jgi:hypothetical protein
MAIMHSRSTLIDASNDILNVFGYRSNLAVLDELNEFANAFEANIIPAVQGVISGNTGIYRLEVVDVTDGVLYLDRTYATPYMGAGGGASEPAFTSWGFKYNRATLGKRSGGKRFGLVPDGAVVDGVAVAPYPAALTTLANALSDPLPILLVDTWFPEILERKPVGVYPWTSHPISAVTYQRVTTQNSRKR